MSSLMFSLKCLSPTLSLTQRTFQTYSPLLTTTLLTKDDTRNFMSVFPDLVRELSFEDEPHKHVADVNKHLAKCIQYNVQNGKKARGLMVPATYKILTTEAEHTEENIRLANIMGWCVEFLQAFFLVADDIMDNSEMRRGHTCWYKKKDIGMIAINDSLLLESCVYATLENHFRDQPYYLRCLHAFIKTTRHTCYGQSLDLLTSKLRNEDGSVQLEHFNMKRFAQTAMYKTSYYSFFLPVALGMNLAGYTDIEVYRRARQICLDIGHLFQAQDDFIDCFGDVKVTGKIGTDIQDGKCSWLIAMAMQKANKESKAILTECYGKDDEEKVERVKEIYNRLKLQESFKKFEKETYNDIMDQISQIPGEGKVLHPKLFTKILDNIYKRSS